MFESTRGFSSAPLAAALGDSPFRAFRPDSVLDRIFGSTENSSPHQVDDALRRQLGSHAEEVLALRRERDPQMFAEGLLALAGRFEAGGREDLAARVYSTLVSESAPRTGIASRAQGRLDGISGVGAAGPRAEFLLRNLSRQVLDPAPLGGMLAASTVFRLTRIAALTRLSLVARPALPARLSANLLAFSAEALTFPVATHLVSGALGRDLSLAPGMETQIASSFILLGGLRLTGSVGRVLSPPAGTRPALQGLLVQGSMLGGILLGHRVETAIGLRPALDGGTTLMDSLALLLQFNVAGRLTHGVMGERFQRWEQNLDTRTQALSRDWRQAMRRRILPGGAPIAWAAEGGRSHPLQVLGRPLIEAERPHVLQMSGEAKEGPKAPGEASRSSGVVSRRALPEISPQAYIESSPHAVVMFELESGYQVGRILLANSKVHDLLGYTQEETVGRHLLDYIHSRSSKVIGEMIRRFPIHREFRLEDIQLIRKDRSTLWCDLYGKVLSDSQGRPIGLAHVEDVTARHEANSNLEVQEARNQALINAIPDLILRVRRDGQILDVRAESGIKLPLPLKVLLGNRISDLPIPEERRAMWMHLIEQALDTGQTQRKEYSISAENGEILQHEARVVSSGPDEVVAIVRDFTEMREANAARDRLREIVEASADYISMANPDGRIFFNNRAAYTLMGIPEGSDISVKNLTDFHPRWALDKVLREGVPAAREHGIWVGETALKNADGHEIPVSQMIIAHKNEAGEIVYYSTIIRDISPLKRAQEHSIAQNRLEAITLMARGLAHDGNNLSTPLQIRLHRAIKTLERNRGRVPPEDEKAIEADMVVIHNIAQRMQEMFQRFRTLTANPQASEPYDVHSLLRDPATRLQPLVGDEVRLTVRADPQPFRIQIPREQMEDILQNLMVNARDAMRGLETKEISLETSRLVLEGQRLSSLVPPQFNGSVKPGEFLRLTVRDTGAGMTESTRRKVFEPYFTTKASDAGHGGIGLALVHKYIHDAGGFITVRSRLGEGTTFDLYLPKASSSHGIQDPSRLNQIRQTPILIVDDEPNLLKSVALAFRDRGFSRVFTAEDGNAAIALMEANPGIGFLLTDAELPGKSGTQVVAWARRRNPDLPMVLWTGHDPLPFGALMNRFGRAVGKPLAMDEMGNLVEGLISQALHPSPPEE